MAPRVFRPSELLPLWYKALDEELGIAIKTDDRRHIVTVLYEARQREANPALEALMIAQPPGDEVWLVKKEVELE